MFTTKNTFLPLLGIFVSILAVLILAESDDTKTMLPYGFLFFISFCWLLREECGTEDEPLFGGKDNKVTSYTSSNYRCNQRYDYNSSIEKAKAAKVISEENEIRKIRGRIPKNKSIKVI